MNRPLLIAGGGTGGHVIPALAVLEHLPQTEVVWLGTDRLDKGLVFEAGYEHISQEIRGGWGLSSLGQQGKALFKAWRLVQERRPYAVLGTGGYASIPGVLAARLGGARVVLLEPNAYPGSATRLLEWVAHEIAATGEAARLLGTSATATGVPVKESVWKGTKEEARKSLGYEGGLLIAITGGSQGAKGMNALLVTALQECSPTLQGARWLWQAGPQAPEVQRSLDTLGIRGRAVSYVDDLPLWLRAADLVVARAGASTLAELAAIGQRSLLIPYPGAGAHQEANGRIHATFPGNGMVLQDAPPHKVLESIEFLLSQPPPPPRSRLAARQVAKWLQPPTD